MSNVAYEVRTRIPKAMKDTIERLVDEQWYLDEEHFIRVAIGQLLVYHLKLDYQRFSK